ncbi:MAG TPA: hypothetical protein VIM48_07180 [Chthoniobacterales bacterium]
MNFQRVFAIINEMQKEGIVERYAIGGAVGATFYLEPVATLDVDVFVVFPSRGSLIDPAPVFDWLKARGGVQEGEYIILEQTPVQILAAGTPLVEEALREAGEVDVEGVPVRVFTAEHLAAIALEVGRAKDKARVLQFVEEGALDAARFEAILALHGLEDRWHTFQRQFLE